MTKIINALAVFLFFCFTTHPGNLMAEESLVPIYGLLFSSDQGLSESQKEFVAFAGYPQQFIKTFENVNGLKRINESWAYASLGFVESFINGRLVGERALEVSASSLKPGELHPEDYNYGQSTEAIVTKHGSPLSIRKNPLGDGTLLVYVYRNVTFAFQSEQLVSVVFTTNQLVASQ